MEYWHIYHSSCQSVTGSTYGCRFTTLEQEKTLGDAKWQEDLAILQRSHEKALQVGKSHLQSFVSKRGMNQIL